MFEDEPDRNEIYWGFAPGYCAVEGRPRELGRGPRSSSWILTDVWNQGLDREDRGHHWSIWESTCPSMRDNMSSRSAA